MKFNTASLFAVPALIWGSTFFVIKFQLGVVDPTWSVSYRFMLAGLILLGFSKVRGLSLDFTWEQHRFIFLQGIFLFGINYWLVYIAEQVLVSALAAVAFSIIIFLNILFGSLFLKKRSEPKVFVGAIMGFIGTFILFRTDLARIAIDDLPVFHLVVCFISVVVASLGNIASARNQAHGLPVIQTNAFGMLYGGMTIGVIALFSGIPMTFDFSFEYIGSLAYLSIFGSILAFGAYLTLIGKIGADKAAYVLIMIPIIAVSLSILFEDYPFGWEVIAGIGLILAGNIVVLRKKK